METPNPPTKKTRANSIRPERKEELSTPRKPEESKQTNEVGGITKELATSILGQQLTRLEFKRTPVRGVGGSQNFTGGNKKVLDNVPGKSKRAILKTNKEKQCIKNPENDYKENLDCNVRCFRRP